MIDTAFDIGSKIVDSKSLAMIIQAIVETKKIDHFDAVLEYCENNEIDYEQIALVIDNTLKAKIQECAVSRGMLKTNVKNTLFGF